MNSKDAYNKADAIANERESYDFESQKIESIVKDTNSANKNEAFVELIKRSKGLCFSSTKINALEDNGLFEEWAWRIIFPTDFSLSGIGAIWLHKNILDKIVIGLSIFLSLVTLVLWRFLHKRRWATMVISINLGSIVIFILSGLISNVTLLYGTWTLLFLLIAQVLTEIQLNKSNKSADTPT